MAPQSTVLFNQRDITLPDLVVGEKADADGAIIVINASTKTLTGKWITCAGPGLQETKTAVPLIPPLATRKVPFHIRGAAPAESGEIKVTLNVAGGSQVPAANDVTLGLRVRKPTETRKITFVSKIDGSVQYYAVNPAPEQKPGLALFLSLHGASVEAIGQADAYAGKSWGNLVAPTNRRPYGFDWEDWGRLDAMEVLELATARLKPDPRRVYLTGHSMGGHGTWHIGVTFPDKFAAIGPSAGWISLFSYAGAARPSDASAVLEMAMRPMQPSDTLSLIRNTVPEGVYILHGDADDNVPVTEAREMKRQLQAFHRDLATWEQPGAGHWWGTDQKSTDEKYGAACVDWKPMFEFFAAHKLPLERDVREIEFRTADPGVSAWYRWAGIMAQEHRLKVSSISLRFDPGLHRIEGKTDNVMRLCLRPPAQDSSSLLALQLDDQVLSTTERPTPARPLWLTKRSGQWTVDVPPKATEKTPDRSGPFKQAFRNQMIFVYGTQGSEEENAWAYSRARYDAEQFWYRGNGSVDIVADVMTVNCERWAQISFSSQYFDAGQKILVRNDSPVQSISELDGKRMCAARGSTNIDELRNYPKIVVVPVDDISDCMVLFQQGTVDSVTGDDTVLAGFVAQDPYAKVVGGALTSEPYGLGVAKEHPEFVRFVNGVLEEVRDSGRWGQMYRTWLAPNGPVPAPPVAVYGRTP
jgi:pimeloyl-ACP methyl ester carboxylesterase